MVIYFANNMHRGSYFQYRNGDFDNTTGGTVHYSYRTGSETQYVQFYEDVYQNGELYSTEWLLSLGAVGKVEVYPQVCENILDDLDAVISNNDTVVLIRMVTSQKP